MNAVFINSVRAKQRANAKRIYEVWREKLVVASLDGKKEMRLFPTMVPRAGTMDYPSDGEVALARAMLIEKDEFKLRQGWFFWYVVLA